MDLKAVQEGSVETVAHSFNPSTGHWYSGSMVGKKIKIIHKDQWLGSLLIEYYNF